MAYLLWGGNFFLLGLFQDGPEVPHFHVVLKEKISESSMKWIPGLDMKDYTQAEMGWRPVNLPA
jgi:hypothetical protein